ncbi:MAG: transcriptional regulator [Bacteroidales bacterium]|nr:transcriptional regulator [Bacteroidales bacterium]
MMKWFVAQKNWPIINAGVDEADFTYLKKQTGATSGNLSVQIEM